MPADTETVLTVSQLTREIRSLLEEEIGDVWVEGEVSNLRVQSSGHQYFTLKDAECQLSFWREVERWSPGAGSWANQCLRRKRAISDVGEVIAGEGPGRTPGAL